MEAFATWLFEHGERISAWVMAIGLIAAFVFNRLYTAAAVAIIRDGYEKRIKESRDDCQFSRDAHERLLQELERTITLSKTLATKVPTS